MNAMMKQYREAKIQYPEMVLMFRMGDFYEMFDDDAQIAANVLGLTMTQRDNIDMIGFPHHVLEKKLHAMLRSGHRVAICEQVK